jgi:hypothetical protein
MVSKKQETVVIQDHPKKGQPNKMVHVQAQPHTHFRLKQKSDRTKLLDIINGISDAIGPIMASYDYGRKHNTDIIIRRRSDMKGEPIGKIHLLLFDKPNRYDHNKYYIKLHFFQFENDDLFDKVKTHVTSFFTSLPNTYEPYLGNSTRSNRMNRMNRISGINENSHKTIKNSLTLKRTNAMKFPVKIDKPNNEIEP